MSSIPRTMGNSQKLKQEMPQTKSKSHCLALLILLPLLRMTKEGVKRRIQTSVVYLSLQDIKCKMFDDDHFLAVLLCSNYLFCTIYIGSHFFMMLSYQRGITVA